jgi:ribonuclease PH
MRADGRGPDELRPVEIVRGFTRAAPGSVLIRTGRTHVFCTASLEATVPSWREKSGAGWVTAEYEMLPASTVQRRPRSRLRVDGRTREIERLIGRSLRMAVDMEKMGPRMILLDCDVLQADGGTRTAAITGVYVALCDALAEGRRRGWWDDDVLQAAVAAASVGIVGGQPLLDLDYAEDVNATVDCNLVMTDRGEWVEVQATGEHAAYTDEQLAAMLKLGRHGIEQLFQAQRAALRGEANGGR